MSLWMDIVQAVTSSPIYKGALTTGMVLLAIVGALAILLGVAFLLSRFFKKVEEIRRVKKVLIYLLTLSGVVILLFGALIGFIIPIIPGLLLLFLALLLLRRIYKNQWVESNISYLEWKLNLKRKIKRKVKRIKEKGKALKR